MREVNFDGLVGPTHHYAGLSYGNLASMRHAQQLSNPKGAALQGLKKMKRVMDLGIPQAVLPPQERPSLHHLHALGFEKLGDAPPHILEGVCSAAAMWRANSATVTPSCDSVDGRVHLTIANLQSTFHRRIEAEESERLFRFLFADRELFAIHPPLPFADEGAANHIRFSTGVHLFVYGREEFIPEPHLFPARQTREASEAIARIHGARGVFAKQNPALIDKGVFHNDVICCGNGKVLLYHKEAFVDTEAILKQLGPLETIPVEISVEEAVATYLFNSQLLTLPNGSQLLLAPAECQGLNLEWLPFPIEFIDIRESMQNGGGPACVRLIIPLTEREEKKVHQPIFLTPQLFSTLTAWVEKYYRDRLKPEDLADPALLIESQEALDALTNILQLGSFYLFQKSRTD